MSTILSRLQNVESHLRAAVEELKAAPLVETLKADRSQLVSVVIAGECIMEHAEALGDALGVIIGDKLPISTDTLKRELQRTPADTLKREHPTALADCLDSDCPIHHEGSAPFCPNDLEARERFLNFTRRNAAALERGMP